MSTTEIFDVFFSYNRKDQVTVRAVRDALEARDVRVWMDEHQIDPGDRWMQEIQNIITIAPAAAIFLGKDGLGDWQEVELESCYHEHQDRGIPIIPIPLPGVPDNLASLGPDHPNSKIARGNLEGLLAAIGPAEERGTAASEV